LKTARIEVVSKKSVKSTRAAFVDTNLQQKTNELYLKKRNLG